MPFSKLYHFKQSHKTYIFCIVHNYLTPLLRIHNNKNNNEIVM